MTNTIERTTTTNESGNIEFKIFLILRELGIGCQLSGFNALKRAIQMVFEDPSYGDLITKRMYPDIAKEFNATAARMERRMRHAIDSINCDDKIKAVYLGSSKSDYTNKEFIVNLAEYLRYS